MGGGLRTSNRSTREKMRGDIRQPVNGSCVQWRLMRFFRRKRARRNADSTKSLSPRGDLPIYAASLGNPIFVESWNGGSPLNWLEFMGRWEVTRVDRSDSDSDD